MVWHSNSQCDGCKRKGLWKEMSDESMSGECPSMMSLMPLQEVRDTNRSLSLPSSQLPLFLPAVVTPWKQLSEIQSSSCHILTLGFTIFKMSDRNSFFLISLDYIKGKGDVTHWNSIFISGLTQDYQCYWFIYWRYRFRPWAI